MYKRKLHICVYTYINIYIYRYMWGPLVFGPQRFLRSVCGLRQGGGQGGLGLAGAAGDMRALGKIHINLIICRYRYGYVYVYLHTHVCVYLYVYVYIHTCMYVYIYIYIHIRPK